MLFMVTRAAGSLAQHEASKTQLWLALECLNPTMFNWVETVAENMKRQLTNYRRGEAKQFGYGSILVPLMLERVPALQLQDIDLDLPGRVRRGPHDGPTSCHKEVADDQWRGGNFFESGWSNKRSSWRIGHMPAWTSVDILTCSCPLESSGMTVVRHLITFFYFYFYDVFYFFMYMS